MRHPNPITSRGHLAGRPMGATISAADDETQRELERFFAQSGVKVTFRNRAADLSPEFLDALTIEALLKYFDQITGGKFDVEVTPHGAYVSISVRPIGFRPPPPPLAPHEDDGDEDGEEDEDRPRGRRRRGAPVPARYASVVRKVQKLVFGSVESPQKLQDIEILTGYMGWRRRLAQWIPSRRRIEIDLTWVDGALKPHYPPTSENVFEALLGHEYAHAVVSTYVRSVPGAFHQRRITAHGPEWKEAMRALGVNKPYAHFHSGWFGEKPAWERRPRRNAADVVDEAWFANPDDVREESWFA